MVDESKFDELCRLIGLAVLMGQKVQFALAHYHAYHKMVHSGLPKAEAKAAIVKSLSKTLGGVVTQIKSETPLPPEVGDQLDAFLKERNWLAHDFDNEATPVIAAGKDFTHFLEKMVKITQSAESLMVQLDQIGNALAAKGG